MFFVYIDLEDINNCKEVEKTTSSKAMRYLLESLLSCRNCGQIVGLLNFFSVLENSRVACCGVHTQ